VVISFLPKESRAKKGFTDKDEEDEQWGELLARVDSSRFTRLFRDLVLLAGLLRLRESSEAALIDLETIMGETEAYSKRIGSARDLHPEVKILKAIQGNIKDFSSQTLDFQKALTSSQLRVDLELLSLSLEVSNSNSSLTRDKKSRFARKLTKLAKRLRSKEEESKLTNLLAKTLQPHEDGNTGR
jgi:hypothetical protein